MDLIHSSKQIFLLLCLVLFNSIGFSQTVFQARYPGGGNGFEICNAHGGGFVAVNLTPNADDISLTQVAADGAFVDRILVNDGSWWSQGYDIKATTDGGYIAAGYSTGGAIGAGDAVLVKLDASLSVQWRRCYGTTEGREAAYSVVEVEDGYVFTGEAGGGGDGSTFLPIAKVDLTGNLLWSKIYIDPARIYGNPSGHTIISTSDKGFAIAASWGAYPAIYDMVLGKFDGNGDLSWIKAYGLHGFPGTGGEAEQSFSVVETPDDGFALAGYASTVASGDQVFLVRTDAGGNPIFQRYYGTDALDEQAEDIEITPEGDFVLTGTVGPKMLLMKVLSNGSLLWAHAYNNMDVGFAVKLAPDNGFVVVGSHPWDDLAITKTDVNGFTGCDLINLTFSVSDCQEAPMDLLDFQDLEDWTDGGDPDGETHEILTPEFDCCDIGLTCTPTLPNLSRVHKYIGLPDRHDYGYGIEQMANGGFLVAGWDEAPGSPATDRDATLTELDQSGRWCWTVNYELGGDEYAYAVVPIEEEDCGGIFLAGARKTTGSKDMLLIKTDGSGGPYWTNTVGGTRDEVAYAAIEVAGGYVAAGYTESYGQGDKDIYIVKIDPSGALLWTAVLGGTEDDIAYGLFQAFNGDVLVTGTTEQAGGTADFYLARLNPVTGAVIWQTKTGINDWEEIGFDVWENAANGYIYVVGSGRGGTALQLDPMLLITDGAGVPLTRVQFPSPDLDEAYSIAPTATGNLFLAGYTKRNGAVHKDALLIECQLNGNYVGAMWYGNDGNDVGRSVFTDFQGRPVVIGETNSFGNGNYDMYFLKMHNLTTTCYEDELVFFPNAVVPPDNGDLILTTGGLGHGVVPNPDNLIETQATVCDYEEDDGGGSGTDKRAITMPVLSSSDSPVSIIAYPNPSSGKVQIDLHGKRGSGSLLQVLDLTGRIVLEQSVTENHLELDLTPLGSGLYFLRVANGQGQATCKIQLSAQR